MEDSEIRSLKKRTDTIINRFFKIWEIPEIDAEEIFQTDEVNIFEAESPTGKKLEYAKFFDQKLKIETVSKLYENVIKQLFELETETFFTTKLAESLSLTQNPKEINLREPLKINNTYYIEKNYNNEMKFEKLKQLLTTLELKDELVIKFKKEIATTV